MFENLNLIVDDTATITIPVTVEENVVAPIEDWLAGSTFTVIPYETPPSQFPTMHDPNG